MDGKITGYSPPDKFYFDLQRFDLVTERQLDQPGETIVAKVASTEQAQVNVASDEVVEPAALSDTQGADAVFSCVKNGKTYYGTAADFTTENLAGATEINILGNFTLSSAAVSGLTATINVKDGAQFTVNKGITTSSASAINVESGGSLSVTAGTITGGSANAASVIVNGGGSFNMSGGTIKNNETGTAIDFRGTTGTISGGTIGETNDATSLNVTAGEITISGGTFSSGTTSISCSGGTVNITNSTSKFAVAVADSSNITKPSVAANVDGKYSYYNSLEDATANCVASIGEGNNIRYYTTLSNAISGAKDNETIKLLKNVTNSAQITFSASKTITLDLAGHSYGFKTYTNNSGFGAGILCKNLNLTIMSSVAGAKVDFNQSKYGFYFNRSSTNYTVNIGANVEFTNIADTFIQGQGSNSTYTVNMTGSTVTAPDGILITQNSTGTVDMSGGTINAKTFGIVDNGTDTDKTVDINISGTAVINSEKYGIYHPHQGKVTVSGGTITGGETGIELRAGSIEVTGGTISGKATAGSYSSIANGNGTTSKGVGIAIAQHTTKKNITANISGGTIIGDIAFDIANPQGNKEGEGELTVDISGGTFTGTSEAVASTDNRVSKDFVTGGVFSTDVADYIADEYKENYQYLDGKTFVGASKDKMTATAYSLYIDDVLYYYSTAPTIADGKITVDGEEKADVVAQIGTNKYYTSFATAKAKAASGDTIKLLADVNESSAVTISDELTIDLNGKTLTGSSGITVSGTLNVIDSAGGSGTLAAAITNSGTVNVSSGKISRKVTNNGTFNMSGGTIETTDDAIENNGTLNFSGGKIRAGGIGINNKGTNNIYGGSIFGKTGIKMLLGVLSILGGKIRGYANGIPQNANVPEVISPENTVGGNTSDGVAIFIAPEKTSTEGAELTVNIGDPNNKADIDIAGTAAALNVGSATGTVTAPEVEVNLNDGKLSSVTLSGSTESSNSDGSAISYNNAEVQLNIDGVILENKFEIGSNASSVEVGKGDASKKINITSMAVNSTTASDSDNKIKTLLGTETSSLDGGSYNEVGGAVSKNIVAEIGTGENAKAYSSLNKAIEVISADDYIGESNVTLKKSMNISEQVNVDVAKDISLNFGDNKLTYAGTDNAGLVVTSGTLNIDTDKGIVNSNGALGIVIKEGATVMVNDQTFTEAAKIKTGSGDAASFQDINDAMRQLDQPGETIVAKVASTEPAAPSTVAEEADVVTPADVTEQTVTWNTYNDSGWTGWKNGTFAQFKEDAESGKYSNVQLDSNLTLESDVNSKAFILAASDNITLDLNGHKLTATSIYNYGGNFTIKDGASGGSIDTGSNYIYNTGTLTVENGTVNVGLYGIYNDGGTVNLNGGTVNNTDTTYGYYAVYNTGSLTMNGGTINMTNATYTGSDGKTYDTVAVFVYGSNGSFTMEDGAAISTSGRGVNVQAGASFTMNGGTIGTDSNRTNNGVGVFGQDSAFTMKGGSIYANDSFGVFNNGSNNAANWGTKITINDGIISSINAAGIYNPAVNSELTITGGTIEGETGVEIRAGELTVTGGTINGTANNYSCNPNGNGSTTVGAGIAVAQHTTKQNIDLGISGGLITGVVGLSITNPQGNSDGDGDLTIDITGGTFSGTSGTPIASGNADDRVSINIAGGTFNGQLATASGKTLTTDSFSSDIVADAYKITDGVFTYDVGKYIAKGVEYQYLDGKSYVGASKDKMTETAYSQYIDGVLYYYSTSTDAANDLTAKSVKASIGTNKYYTSFENAKEAAASGDTIKLFAETVNADSAVAIDNELTIDLNGKQLTGSAISVSGTLNVIDSSADKDGTLAAAVTVESGGSANVLSGKVTEKVTNNGTFNMSGGSIETADNAINNESGGTVKVTGGTIRSGAIGISNRGTSTNIYGGSIFGMVGIKMLLGALSVLGGKIRGYTNGAFTAATNTNNNVPEVVSPEEGADIASEAGSAISIAQEGNTSEEKVAVTIGQPNADTKADIDIAGTKTALNIGKSKAIDADAAPSVSLFEGKLSAVVVNETTGEESAPEANAEVSAISYVDSNTTSDAKTKLTIDGAILKNKIDVSTATNIGSAETTGETTNSIVIKKVAINSTAANNMIKSEGTDLQKDIAKAFKSVFQMDVTNGDTVSETNVATMKLDGDDYGFVGSATTKADLDTAIATAVGEASVAKIGNSYYSGLAEAIAKASTNDEITLNGNIKTANQLTLSDSIKLKLGGKTFTYTGEGNAALTIDTNAKVTLDTDQLLDSNGNVLGIAMADGASVYINGQLFNQAAYLPTGKDGVYAYFQDINNAMRQLDQPGEVLVASIFSAMAGGNDVPADEPGVVTPAQVTDGQNLRITLSGSEVELAGLAEGSEVTISNDNNITLNESNFGSGIRVLSNGGNYKFNLVTGGTANDGTKSFTGSDVGEVISNAIGSLTLSGAGGADTITNTGASATINGGEGADQIINSGLSASIDGGADADTINNSSGSNNSSVYGGAGNDVISNGAKSAYLFGGAGNDKITNTYTPTDGDTTVVTIDGGDGSDTLVGYSTGKELFYYSKGNDSITGYGEGDIISLTGTAVAPFTDISKFSVDSNKFTFNFGTNNTVNVDVSGVNTVSIQSGNDNYYYSANSVAKNMDGITLTSAYTTPNFSASISGTENSYTTVDASAVTIPVSIKGVDGKDNYLIASESKGGTLDAGTGKASDSKGNSLVGGTGGADLFVHTVNAHDIIYNYSYGTDSVSVSSGGATDLEKGINYDGSNFVVSLGASDSLTFNTASAVELTNGTDTYYYAPDQAMKDGTSLTLRSTFSTTTFDLNASKWNGLYADVSSIDASAVTQDGGLKITGISGNANWIKSASLGGAITGGANGNTLISATDSVASLTLTGGEGADSLKGGSGKDLFVYTGGADSINNYASGDIVRVNNTYRLAEATVSVGTPDASNGQASISLTFDNANTLVFEGIGSLEAVRVQQGTGSNYYTYAQQYYAHNNSVTLNADYDDGKNNDYKTFDGTNEPYETINAAAVNNAISIMGNSLNNYIFGATAQGGSINGGTGNDKINVSDRSSTASYLFEYTAGKDEIIGFASGDSVNIDPTSITAAKSSNSNTKLALTVDKNKNVLTLRSDDEITKVTLAGDSADYLTKDGYVKGQGFSLFGSARGSIDLKDALYTGSNISLVAADSVKSQSVTLTGGTQGGTFIYAENNKRRDGFVYGGGAVSISGYEAGRDRIDLNAASLTSFSVDNTTKEVVLNVSDGGTISISGAGGEEVLLHDATRGRAFKKMVFKETGVIENKQKNPTMVTVSGAADDYSAADTPSIKKIYVTGIGREGFSVQAGDKNNTQIDASAAGKAISLSGGAKNDKLIGSSANDLFVYSAGKDVLQGYGEGDSISISSDLASSLGSAKITAGSKSIKFQFTSKNSLTIKSNTGETLSNTLNINGEEKTYAKNAIESGGQATLTSAYSGTFNTASTKGIDGAVSTVDGSAVSKNLTYKGSTAAESLTGGTRKTTFKGAGGADTLVGGSGKDIFFYAKNDAGTTTIADFEFGANKDKLKIASGTISEISSVTADSNTAIRFAMNSGKNTANVGWFQVTNGATYANDGTKTNKDISANNVAIKANNTFYWFADKDITEVVTVDGGQQTVTLASAGQLITSDSRVSASDVSSFDIIDLNYSTNLAKAGVAVKVTGAKPK